MDGHDDTKHTRFFLNLLSIAAVQALTESNQDVSHVGKADMTAAAVVQAWLYTDTQRISGRTRSETIQRSEPPAVELLALPAEPPPLTLAKIATRGLTMASDSCRWWAIISCC